MMNATVNANTRNNKKIFSEIMQDTEATHVEAVKMCEFDCTLEEAQEIIKQSAEYEELVTELLPGKIEYLRNEYYKGVNVDDDFIEAVARELIEDYALEIAFLAKQ